MTQADANELTTIWLIRGEIKVTERYLRTLTNVVTTDKGGKRRNTHLLSDNILMTMTKLKLLGKIDKTKQLLLDR